MSLELIPLHCIGARRNFKGGVQELQEFRSCRMGPSAKLLAAFDGKNHGSQ